MGYVLSKIVGILLTPGAILLTGLVIGSLLSWTRRHWRIGRGILSATALLVLSLAMLPLDEALMRPLENRFPANPTLPDHIDGIIVLGGAVNPSLSLAHGQISLNDAAERLVEGARLGRAHPEARVVFTGGAADPLRPNLREAQFAAQAMVDMGLPVERLVIEDASRNTFENAVFSQRLTQPQKGQVWVLVTSARHMARSVGVFRAVDWAVIPWPVDYTTGGAPQWVNADPLVGRLQLVTSAVHEWAGLLFYRLSGWTDSLFPEP